MTISKLLYSITYVLIYPLLLQNVITLEIIHLLFIFEDFSQYIHTR